MEGQEQLYSGLVGGIILMAALHGLLMAAILCFSEKLKSKANRYLALALLGICVILGYEFSYYIDAEDDVPLIIQYLPLYVRSVIPIGIFFYATYLIDPQHKKSSLEKAVFIPLALEGLLNLLYIPINAWIKSDQQIALAEEYIEIAGQVVGLTLSLTLLPLALKRVGRYQRFLFNNYSTAGGGSLRWLQRFLVCTLFVVAAWLLSFSQYLLGYYNAADLTFFVVTICLVALLFWIGYFVILHYSWFEIVPFKAEQPKEEPTGNKLSTKTEIYHQGLIALMQEERLFENIDLTLDMLAERLKISSGYLSQIINEREEKNFFEFVNRYRIEAVKEKLQNSAFENYTIFGIALESGFKSKSTFNAVFKKFTGSTPSEFKREHVK